MLKEKTQLDKKTKEKTKVKQKKKTEEKKAETEAKTETKAETKEKTKSKIKKKEELVQSQKSPALKIKEDKEIKKMFEVGMHFGHRRTKKHPKMDPFIYCTRDTVNIIDLLKTKEYLKKTLDYLKQRKKEEALMLFVGTKISVRELLRNLATELKMPYVVERWLGGTLTNFEIINRRIQYLKEMEEKKIKGEFKKYKKKERIKIDKDIARVKRRMEGLVWLDRLPDLLFVVDIGREKMAVKEAKMKGIPIVGICDTDSDLSLANYAIPANDDAISSLKYILEKVKKVLK